MATEIGFQTVVKLVQNFIDNTFKGSKKVTPDKDAHAVYYSKTDIDALFVANGFDPAKPDDPLVWKWQESPGSSLVKPDGN